MGFFYDKIFINLKTDWQSATKSDDDGVGEIKKPKVIMTPLKPKARAFIERDRAVISRCRTGDNRAVFEGYQTKQVKASW